LRHPNGILIITPESLESFLINKKQYVTDVFKWVKYVIVDEFHSFLGKERGMQLISLLTKIEYMIHRNVPRIAMSATFSNYSDVISSIRNKHDSPCVVIEDKKTKHKTKILLKEIPTANKDENIISDLFIHLRGSNNLVFPIADLKLKHI